MRTPPLVTDYSGVETTPLTDVSFSLMLDYASQVELRNRMPEPLRAGFAALAGRRPGPHVTLAVPFTEPSHARLERVRHWFSEAGPMVMQRVQLNLPVLIIPFGLTGEPGGIRLLVDVDIDLRATGVETASAAAGEAIAKAAGSDPPPNGGVCPSFHISLATIDQTSQVSEVMIDDGWFNGIQLSGNRIELSLATASPYANLTSRLPTMPIAPGSALQL